MWCSHIWCLVTRTERKQHTNHMKPRIMSGDNYMDFHLDYPSNGGSNMKTLHNSDVSGARQNVKDIRVVGNGDTFRLLAKASSDAEGWMKSTKAMQVPGGCVVQVTTQQRNPDGSYAVAEALTFVPGVSIADDENSGRKLVAGS